MVLSQTNFKGITSGFGEILTVFLLRNPKVNREKKRKQINILEYLNLIVRLITNIVARRVE